LFQGPQAGPNYTMILAAVASLSIAGHAGRNDQLLDLMMVIHQNVQEIRCTPGVDIHVPLDLILRLTDPYRPRQMINHLMATNDATDRLIIPRVAPNQAGARVQIIRRLAVGMYLGIQAIKDGHLIDRKSVV